MVPSFIPPLNILERYTDFSDFSEDSVWWRMFIPECGESCPLGTVIYCFSTIPSNPPLDLLVRKH